jgi:hypothetical protein
MTPDNLLAIASFTPNSLEAPNAWVGHLPFAAWVMQEVSPKIFVELGTHSGNSYFSFCQSVLENGLATKCYAVDTWQGDEHAGQYNETIFNKVNTHHQERYAEFSRLLRMTFDDAVGYFADESIELLHIDGLHTYEAVAHDFESWLPKLAPGAVVMFHDTNVRERNFGVWKLWEELQVRYPNNLEFVHSHGLGVLQINASSNQKKAKILNWLKSNNIEKQRLINYFSALGSQKLNQFELLDLKQHVFNLDQVIANLNLVIQNKDKHVASLEKIVQDRDTQITSLNNTLLERDQRNAEQMAVMVSQSNQTIEEHKVQLATFRLEVENKSNLIINLEKTTQDLEDQLGSLTEALAQKTLESKQFKAEKNQLTDMICAALMTGQG